MVEVESGKKAFKKFYKKLIEALPVNDLITDFCANKLLPGNHKAMMESLSTRREKAQYFLDEVIKPGLHIGYIGQFSKTIDIMESSDNPVVKHLVKQIQEYMLVASPSSSDDDESISLLRRMDNLDPSVSLNEIKQSEKVKKRKPTELYLQRLFVSQHATQWRDIGLALGFSTGELDNIQMNHSNKVEDRCKTVLMRWLEKDTQATWGKLFDVIDSHLDTHHLPTNSGPASTTMHMDSVDFSQNEILQQEPKIGDLFEFVVPQIKAHWEEVAYIALRYDIPTVEGIQTKHLNDVNKCCQEMFKIWLTTSHGVKPKTWSTLLTQLKKVEKLVAGTEVIEKRLKNLQL